MCGSFHSSFSPAEKWPISSLTFQLLGLPNTRVSDILTSHFRQALFKSLGSQLAFSTANHPQTDGQTKRLNQCLESYLRCMCFYCPMKKKVPVVFSCLMVVKHQLSFLTVSYSFCCFVWLSSSTFSSSTFFITILFSKGIFQGKGT